MKKFEIDDAMVERFCEAVGSPCYCGGDNERITRGLEAALNPQRRYTDRNFAERRSEKACEEVKTCKHKWSLACTPHVDGNESVWTYSCDFCTETKTERHPSALPADWSDKLKEALGLKTAPKPPPEIPVSEGMNLAGACATQMGCRMVPAEIYRAMETKRREENPQAPFGFPHFREGERKPGSIIRTHRRADDPR